MTGTGSLTGRYDRTARFSPGPTRTGTSSAAVITKHGRAENEGMADSTAERLIPSVMATISRKPIK